MELQIYFGIFVVLMGMFLAFDQVRLISRHVRGIHIYLFDKFCVQINNNTLSEVTVGTEGNMDAFLNALMPVELEMA